MCVCVCACAYDVSGYVSVCDVSGCVGVGVCMVSTLIQFSFICF